MTDSEIKFIISRIIDNANFNLEEVKGSPDDLFLKGKKLAYYEILDSIKNELISKNQDLKEFGLDIILDKMDM